MKKILFALLAAAMLIGCQEDAELKTKIGIILPLSGNGAIYGEDLKRGIDLAYEQSIIKNKVEIIYQDDAADTRMGISALNSLKSQGVSICIGGVMSNVANGLLPIANNNNIFLLSPKATDINLSKNDDMFYRIWPTDDLDGKMSAQYINNNLTYKKIAILYSNTDYGVGIRKLFKDHLSNDSVIVFDESFNSDISDFKPIISKLKLTNPDIVFLPAYYREVVMALKCMNELNCNFYISGVSSFYDENVKISAGKLLNQTFFTYPTFSVDADSPATKYFVKTYYEKYKTMPNAFSAHGYDSYIVLETIISSILSQKDAAEKINGRTIKEYIENNHNLLISGATGDIHFDKNGDAIRDLQIIWLKDINNEKNSF